MAIAQYLEDKQFTYKIGLIGDKDVGKTTLNHKLENGKFLKKTFKTLGVDIKVKREIYVNNYEIKMIIFDISGEERFYFLTPTYLKGLEGIIFVYDITKKEGINYIKKWLKDFEKYLSKDFPIILLGCKLDLKEEREVMKKDIKKLTQEISAGFHYECSSKLSDEKTIKNIFSSLAKMIYTKKEKKRKNNYKDIIFY